MGGAVSKKVTTIARTGAKPARKKPAAKKTAAPKRPAAAKKPAAKPAAKKQKRITYSPELVASILDRVSNGEPLSRVCSGDKAPSRKSFFAWIIKYPDIQQQYEMAIAMRADLYAEETITIADEDVATVSRGEGEDTEVVFDSAAVARNRLRIDARKWYASKLAPKKYGDRVEQVHSGSVGLGSILNEIDGTSAGLPTGG